MSGMAQCDWGESTSAGEASSRLTPGAWESKVPELQIEADRSENGISGDEQQEDEPPRSS